MEIAQNSNTNFDFLGVSFADANHGIAVGFNGIIKNTTDGGNTWNDHSYQISGNWLYRVSYPVLNYAYIAGDNGIVLKTTDSGNSWTNVQDINNSLRLFGIAFTDSNKGYAAGEAGTVLKTTDGGNSWTSQTTVSTNNLRGISFSDINNVTVIGDWGTIMRTKTGGATFVEDKFSYLIKGYQLFQNYHNPFNPTTAISYQLSAFSHVTLKVYDILGREVQTLVNEYEQAGKYTIRFDASKMAGGVYYYKLQAGNFNDVKKLVLLK